MKKLKSVIENLSSSRFLPVIALLAFVALHAQGYCNGNATTTAPSTSAWAMLERAADWFGDLAFSYWARKIALVIGAVTGFYKSVNGGGWVPLVSFGGLGAAYNFLPFIIDFFSRVKI